MVTTYPEPLDSRVSDLESDLSDVLTDVSAMQSDITSIKSKNTSQDTSINGKQASIKIANLTNPRTVEIAANGYTDFYTDWSIANKNIIAIIPRYAGSVHAVITNVWFSNNNVVLTVRNLRNTAWTPTVNSMVAQVLYT